MCVCVDACVVFFFMCALCGAHPVRLLLRSPLKSLSSSLCTSKYSNRSAFLLHGVSYHRSPTWPSMAPYFNPDSVRTMARDFALLELFWHVFVSTLSQTLAFCTFRMSVVQRGSRVQYPLLFCLLLSDGPNHNLTRMFYRMLLHRAPYIRVFCSMRLWHVDTHVVCCSFLVDLFGFPFVYFVCGDFGRQ